MLAGIENLQANRQAVLNNRALQADASQDADVQALYAEVKDAGGETFFVDNEDDAALVQIAWDNPDLFDVQDVSNNVQDLYFITAKSASNNAQGDKDKKQPDKPKKPIGQSIGNFFKQIGGFGAAALIIGGVVIFGSKKR